MNTIMIVSPELLAYCAAHTYLEPNLVEYTREVSKALREHHGAAWYVIPGSLHGSGEVYRYYNGRLLLPSMISSESADGWLLTSAIFSSKGDTVDGIASDIILPRGIEDDLRSLAGQYEFVYLIRNPAIGLGKLSYLVGVQYAPVLVQKRGDLGKSSALQQKQKHVSKPNTPK